MKTRKLGFDALSVFGFASPAPDPDVFVSLYHHAVAERARQGEGRRGFCFHSFKILRYDRLRDRLGRFFFRRFFRFRLRYFFRFRLRRLRRAGRLRVGGGARASGYHRRAHGGEQYY